MNSERLLPILTKAEFMDFRSEPYKAVALMEKFWVRNDPNLSLADFVSAAALAYAARANKIFEKKELYALAENSSYDDLIKSKFMDVIERYPSEIFRLAEKRNENQLLSLIAKDLSWFFRSMGKKDASISTPPAFSVLAHKLLDVQPGESVMDFTAGSGEFLINTFLQTKARVILGTEISEDAVITGTLRSSLLGDHAVCIHTGNSVISGDSACKVFADTLELETDADTSHWEPRDPALASCYREVPQTRCTDWMMVLSALEKQIPGGRSVILTYDGFLIRQSESERKLRSLLVESGRLEAVISLPTGILPDVEARCAMLVFSQGNQTVKMVDGRDCRDKTRYASVMKREHIDEILNRCCEETEFSHAVTFREIADQEFELHPSGYLPSGQMDVEQGKRLEEVIHFLKRGQMIPADYLNKYATHADTGFQYLMLKDLEDETIHLPLTFLDKEAIEQEEQEKAKDGLNKMSLNWDNYCVEEDYLVISRSMPIKMALVPDPGKEKVLANVNLYFMKIDQRVIHPVYLLCYLKSPIGFKKLGYLYKGSGIKTVSRKDLLQLQIPIIPMAEQKEIAHRYLEVHAELMELRKKKHSLEERLEDMLEAAFQESEEE